MAENKISSLSHDDDANYRPNCGADMRPNESVKTEVLNEQIQC